MLTPRFTGRVAISQQKDLGWSVCTLTTITLSSIYADPHLGNILTVTFVAGHRLITSHGKATLIWCISNTWEYRRLSPNRTHSPLECTVTILLLTVSYINSAFRFIQIYVPGNEGNSGIGSGHRYLLSLLFRLYSLVGLICFLHLLWPRRQGWR